MLFPVMARAPRHQPAGVIQHVTARTTRGVPLFEADAERRLFLALLDSARLDFGWTCLSYCLMSNHVHVLVRPTVPSLSRGMQQLAARYARYYNDRRQRYGHVFQGRFGSKAVTTESYLREVMRYIALNPVRAGLCGAPGDYPWSAHRALTGGVSSGLVAMDEALRAFGASGPAGVTAYRAFVTDRAAGEKFAATYESSLLPSAPERPDVEELARGLDRDTLIVKGHLEFGHSFAAIARALGCHRSTVTRRFARLVGDRATHGV